MNGWVPPLPLWHPEWYQGSSRRRHYFEGWYFKNVTQGQDQCWSLIPGVALDEPHRAAFIQVICATSGSDSQTWYFEYPISAFSACRHPFGLRIGGSRFSLSELHLECGGLFAGELTFSRVTPFPSTLLRPGVMGPYAFAPFMECYHGLVSLDHLVEGTLNTPRGQVEFGQGRGYIEKDWGRSMPSSWVWAQTNHLGREGDSLMVSVARIPWLHGHFTGFLFAAILDGRPLLRTTYTHSSLGHVTMSANAASLSILTGRERIEIVAERPGFGQLMAPVAGVMARRITESVDAHVALSITDGMGHRRSFEGSRAGLDLVGTEAELQPQGPA